MRHLVLCGLVLSACGTPSADPGLAGPSDLTVNVQGAGLHLTWKDNSKDEDEFQIERKGTAGFAMVGTVVFDTVQFHDEPLAAGASYTYRVRAMKGSTPSAYSGTATATAPGGSGGGAGGGGAGGSGGGGGAGGSGGGGGAGGGAGGNQAPSCTIAAPDAGTTLPFDQAFTFTATASDPEDGALAGASVVWVTDRASAPLGSGLTLTRTLPLPGPHAVTCRATDAQGLTGTSTVLVNAFSPVAVLSHPGNGETRPASMAIPFIGDGRDFYDGPLPDAGLRWSSSLDGPIGTGRTFNRTLSAGTNVVTLTVTNSDGGTGSKSITLTITP